MPIGNLVTINFSPTRGGATRTYDVSDANITLVMAYIEGTGSGTDVTTSSYTYRGQVDPKGTITDTNNTGGSN